MGDEPGKIRVVIEGDSSSLKDSATAGKESLAGLKDSISKSTPELKELGAETGKVSEKFIENRREVRAAFNELTQTFGLGRLGGLAVGGFFAALVGMAEAVKFLKWTWDELKDTISGPLEIGIPPEASAQITTAAEAWNNYATALAKGMAAQDSPESRSNEQEKHLENEIKLIHEVLAAQKEKALADLQIQKGSLKPEEYEGARANIENIFAEAGVKADEHNRYQKIVNKQTEAANLEFDAQIKMRQALAIKLAPKETAEANEKFYAEQSAKAEAALKLINDRIAFIKKVAAPDIAPDYEGPFGGARKLLDRYRYYNRYGGTEADFAGNLQIEEQRKAQAQAIIDSGASYKTREEDAAKKRDELSQDAGKETAAAAGIRAQIPTDLKEQSNQNAVDQYIAGLHEQSAERIAGASNQTVMAVKKLTDTTLGGFDTITQILIQHDQRMNQLAARLNATPSHTNSGVGF